MEKLTLADGTQIEPAHVIADGGTLWFYLENGISFADAYTAMADPNKTSRITADRFGESKTYDGFTDLFCLRKDDDTISGGLKRER